MNEITVSIRELKSRLSHYLRLAKAGQIVEITYRGKPVGRIVTVASSLEERIEAVRRSGLLSWNGQKLEPLKPVARLRTKKTVAELVVEDRRCSPKEKAMSTIFHLHLPSLPTTGISFPLFFPSPPTNGRGPFMQRALGKGSSFRGHELL